MADGLKYKLYVSSTGASGGSMTEVELQGDMTVNPGKTNDRTAYKNGALTAQGNDGWSASGTLAPKEPLGTGQQYLWSHFTNGGDTWCEVKSATTGSIKWTGAMKVNITQINLPTKGPAEWTFELSENGTITSATV